MQPAISKSSITTSACSGRFDVVVIGVSAGGVALLLRLLPDIAAGFPLPIVVCIHARTGTTADLAQLLDERSALRIKEAQDKELLQAGTVYLAPGGYHLHLDTGGSCTLSIDPPVKAARPSVDVLFESAAHVCHERVLAVVLSGASDDGAEGVRRVKAAGGMVLVQDPAEAEAPAMPRAALAAVIPDHVVHAAELPELLQRLTGPSQGEPA